MSMVDGTMQPSGPAKLDPATLTTAERAIWDALAVERVTRNSCCPEQAYEITDDWANRLILARRALFGTATEKAVCPNCNKQTDEQNEHSDPWGKGSLKWTCPPAPTKPTSLSVSDHHEHTVAHMPLTGTGIAVCDCGQNDPPCALCAGKAFLEATNEDPA